MPSNTAAWLTAAKANPLEVKSAPYTSPSENEIVVKNGALAINPVDWALQSLGDSLFPWIVYPTIVGSDVAGEVVEIGSGVTRFKVGDRVVGHAVGMTSNNPSASAFQTYTVLLSHMASPIPSTISYENAAVLPLGLSTAACGLFQKDYLALQYPSIPPKPTGKTVLVWSGSSSVGSNGIQLAVAAGYEVITTASPKNWDYVKKLGASQVFDYNSPTVVDDIISALQGKILMGTLAIGNVSSPGNGAAATEACITIVDKSSGSKFVALASHTPENLPAGVSAKFIFGSSFKDNEVSRVIYEDFLPKALEQGSYYTAPEPLVVGKGVEAIQVAFEVQKKGVSVRKMVVSL